MEAPEEGNHTSIPNHKEYIRRRPQVQIEIEREITNNKEYEPNHYIDFIFLILGIFCDFIL